MDIMGTIQNGVVVLENAPVLQDGMRVRVEILDAKKDSINTPSLQGLLELAGTVNDLPSDMALNHDQYLHGHPKK
jgi:hypothetical protein